MLQNSNWLKIVLLLMISGANVNCQTDNSQFMREAPGQPLYDLYDANFEENQLPANGMPFIVKDFDLKPYRSAPSEGPSCADKKECKVYDLKSNGNANESTDTSKKPANKGSSAQAAPSPPASPPAASTPAPSAPASSSGSSSATKEYSPKLHELQKLVQQLYVAQAQVQLEATEIQRTQTIAAAAQQALEEAGNNVRVITAALHAAQQTVAGAALRAQTAQLQLAAHDQLLFTARQRVDALSAQMVGLQAEEGIGENKILVDIPALLAKLKEPLPDNQKPTPVPSILGGSGGEAATASAIHPSPDSSYERSADTKKFYEQLKIWSDQNARKAETLNEKRGNLYDSLLMDRAEIDSPKFDDSSFEENAENALNDELEKPAEVEAPPNSNEGGISEDDVKSLVDFIVTTGHKRSTKNHEKMVENIDESDQKIENKKYFDDFLNSVRNSEIQEPKYVKAGIARKSLSSDTKLSDQILSLHESLLHPHMMKQASQPDDQETAKVNFSDMDTDLDYKVPDRSNEIGNFP